MKSFVAWLKTIPAVPLCAGLAGLIPFWGLALALTSHGFGTLWTTLIDLSLATYAAIILSFLGGIRWGLAVARGVRAGDVWRYGLSVLPSLLAWAMLALPEPARLGALGLLALVLGPIDARLVSFGDAAPWFGRLRLVLSTGAGVALLLGAFAVSSLAAS